MPPLLVVRSWAENFEKNRTRELKSMLWIPVPVKLGGDGYSELLDHPDGAAHFGCWIAILEVAAGCETRGTLMRGDRTGPRRPHDAVSLSRLTRIPASVLSAAIERLLLIGWLVAEEIAESRTDSAPAPQLSRSYPAPPCEMPAPSRARAIEQNSIGKDIEEQEKLPLSAGGGRQGGEGGPAKAEPKPKEPPDFAAFWNLYPRKDAKGDALKAWHQTVKRRPPLEDLLAAVERGIGSHQWQKEGGQFIPMPAGWLRKERWGDTYAPANGSRGDPSIAIQRGATASLIRQAEEWENG